MVPRQSQSYMYISNAEGVVVTQGTPQWYPGNLNPICTLAMQKGSLSPSVLPSGTHVIVIPKVSLSNRVLPTVPNVTQAIPKRYVG